MAKGGKGRKGGGGGGGKTRKYSRDNNGRFAASGTGATARGGRLLTAKGNKRTARALAGKTKTIEAAGKKGVLAKPKGLKPGSIKPKAVVTAKPALKPISPKPANKLRTRLNPAAKTPTITRTRLPGTISRNKQLRTADNRQSAFQRKFGRAYDLGKNRGNGPSVKKAKSERTRGKALDIYRGAKRPDGTESTVGRFPRSRTSTAFKPPSSNIKPARRFAPGTPKAQAPILAPRPEKGNPLAKRAPAGSFRPGQLMNANAFPTNAIAKKPKIKDGYKDVTADMTQTQRRQTIKNNIQLSLDTAKKQTPWLPATIKGNSRSGTVAFVALNTQTGGRRLQVNSSHPRWATPIKSSIEGRRTGDFASAKPAHVINHEIGHAKHRTMGRQQQFQLGDTRIARRVSKYAATNANEFVAEVRGARKVGSRFDAQIMSRYRKYSGLSPKPAPKFRPTAKAKAKAAKR